MGRPRPAPALGRLLLLRPGGRLQGGTGGVLGAAQAALKHELYRRVALLELLEKLQVGLPALYGFADGRGIPVTLAAQVGQAASAQLLGMLGQERLQPREQEERVGRPVEGAVAGALAVVVPPETGRASCRVRV